MGEAVEEPSTPSTPFAGPALRVEVLSVSAKPDETAAWKRVHHASITVRMRVEGQPERVERTATSPPVGNPSTGLSVVVGETLRFPWPGSADGQEALKGDVVVSLRRGVATRGFAPVALAEPFPIADLLALAQNPVRTEALLTARLVGKHGQGPSGKVLLRLSAEGVVPFAEAEPISGAEEAAAIRIQAFVRGHLARNSMTRVRPPASVSSSEALTDDEDDIGAEVDAAVESALPDEVEEAPAHDDDSYSWLEDYERHEFQRWLLRLALKVLVAGAAAGAVRHVFRALGGRKKEEKAAPQAKDKKGKRVVTVTKLTIKKKTI